MWGIPKIVLARLKGGTSGVQSNRQSEIEDRPSGHPDANLLAAFLERTLTERERGQLLSHLAECAECREIAALALPTQAGAAEPARSPVRGGWSIRPILRWSVPAAALAAVVFVVVWRQHWKSPVQTASNTPPPTITTNASAPARQSPLPLPAPPAPRAAIRRSEAKSLEPARRVAKTSPPTPPSHRSTTLSPGNEERALTPSSAQLRPPVATAPVPRSDQSDEVSARPSTEVITAAGQAGVAEHPPASVYERKSSGRTAGASTAMHANALQARLPTAAFRSRLQGAAAQPGSLWSISPQSRLRRSTDGGKNWEEVGVDDKVEFRAIQVNGREVWAGGTGGALYHSSDGGATWTRPNPGSGAIPTTETIVSINCSPDLQHITVKTASGERWTSDDGGQHWRAMASDE